MKKNYLLFITSLLIASVLLIIPGCEEEESDSDNIFTLTDNGYFSAENKRKEKERLEAGEEIT